MKKNMFYFILGVILTTIVGVTALALYDAKDVVYKSYGSSNADNVQDAMEELYDTLGKNEQLTGSNCSSVAEPKIDDGLIPVTIANDGTVKVVSQADKNWYNYCDKKWANAVIVSSGE